MVAGGRFHRDERQDLEQVVLDDVAQRSDRVVEAPAVGDAEVLGHRDHHVRDVGAVPDRFQQRVREAQVGDVHHRLLAEEVVDPVDLRLVEDLEELVVQLASAGGVVAERLLDHDPAAVGEPRVVEAVDDAGEERRRDLQVEDRVAGALQGLAHLPVRARVGAGRP